jgi:hypothetical protein
MKLRALDILTAFLLASDSGGSGTSGGDPEPEFKFYGIKEGQSPEEIAGVTTLNEALAWTRDNAAGADYDSYDIQLVATEEVTDRYVLTTGDKNITILIRGASALANPVVINGKNPNGILQVGKGVSVELGEKFTLDGSQAGEIQSYAGLIAVAPEGKLKMLNGSKICGVTLSSDGAAVFVGALRSAGTGKIACFEMEEGALISGNFAKEPSDPTKYPWPTEYAPASYGAVMVNANGHFTMNGGRITNNTRGVVLGAQDAVFIMNGGSIDGNGVQESGDKYPKGLRAAGVCIGTNLMAGKVEIQGGTISDNGGPGVGTDLPPGGGVYLSSKTAVFILKGVATILNNTVCLTSASSGMGPFITLGPGFTDTNPEITLDLASTRPEWIEKWENKPVLQPETSGGDISDLTDRFELGKFYVSSGNKPFESFNPPPDLDDYEINTDGVLALRPNPPNV